MRDDGGFPLGMVEKIDATGVEGWVERSGDMEVEIAVNGQVVASSFPSQNRELGGVVRDIGFSRTLKGLWKFLGEGDCVQVLYAGRALPIAGHGDRWTCGDERASNVPKLLQRINDGYVFDKYGHLNLSMQADKEYQDWVLDTYNALREEIRGVIGCDSFAIYGTMLGAVREGNFIGHDNDFDMVYVSRFSDPEGVKAEFARLCGRLIDSGYWLHPKKTHTWVRRRGTKQKMDIFFSWFDANGMFHLSYGYHGAPVGREGFEKLVPYKLGNREVMLPEASPGILEQTFGHGWRTPDRGFKHQSPSRRIDKKYFLDQVRLSELYWKQFYRDNNVSDGSQFAKFVAGRLDPSSTVLEIGSGTGRDAIFFAEHGHVVFGADRAAEGVQRASATAGERSLKAAFHVVDASDESELSRFVESVPQSGPLVVYMRFFLHSIPVAVQELIFDVISRLPPGFLLALEFRTDKDAHQPKTYADHYRRFIEPGEVAASLKRRGFTIDFEEQGTGLSPFGDEDPHLARILARKD